jgi:hypothetical protein
MSQRSTSQRVSARVITLVLAGFAAWCMVRLAQHSGHPGSYYPYMHDPARFVYPVQDVGTWCGVIGVELVAAAWAIWYARSLPAVCAALAVAAGLGSFVCVPLSMHAPPYFAMHTVFLIGAALWLGVSAGLAKLVAHLTGARATWDELAAPAPPPARRADDDL